MTVAAEPATGPLVAPVLPTDDALIGSVQDVAAWIALTALEGRYARDRRPGPSPQWYRWVGTRWRSCDEQWVRAAVRFALDDARDRVAAHPRATAYRIDRLDESYVWKDFRLAVSVPPARLGL